MLRILFAISVLIAAATAQTQPEASIRKVLSDQVANWNRGELESFMQGYEKSADTTFIGKTVRHGWQQVLDNYRTNYSTPAKMGALDFSDLAVRMLGSDYAFVTGKFHLARNTESGGEASGIFSLVFRKTPDGWKIILDHTS